MLGIDIATSPAPLQMSAMHNCHIHLLCTLDALRQVELGQDMWDILYV
jgi:hypothetical protein